MGVFSDRTLMDRILFAVFNHENQTQGVSTPFLLTHQSAVYREMLARQQPPDPLGWDSINWRSERSE